nr:unnamed protein product [Callosobruchus analis]
MLNTKTPIRVIHQGQRALALTSHGNYVLISGSMNHGSGGTGTMRDNHTPKSCSLSDKKDLQKKERGYFEHEHSI